MVTGRPLFPGTSEKDQLLKIFVLLGTPKLNTWPGMTKLPQYKTDFPQYEPRDLSKLFPTLSKTGLDILLVCDMFPFSFFFFFMRFCVISDFLYKSYPEILKIRS